MSRRVPLPPRAAPGVALLLAALLATAPGGAAQADLLVSSGGLASVSRFDAVTGAPLGLFVAQGEGGLITPDGLAWGPDGNLYVSKEKGNAVLRYDGKTGAFIDTFVTAGSGGLNIAEDLKFGADGNLYVGSLVGNAVLRYDGKTGAFIDAFVPAGAGGLDGPSGLIFGPDGDLYLASSRNHQVLHYDGKTGAFCGPLVAAGAGGLNEPVGIAFGADGRLYVSSLGNNQVLRFDGKTGAFVDVFVPPASGGLDGPYSLVFGPDGNLYVNSVSNNRVLRYDARTGAPIDVFAAGNGLSFPTYLLFTPSAAGCQDDATHVCLQQGRFRVAADWQTAQGGGAGQAVRLTADTAYFWFFSDANVEVLVKVLDGCALAPGRFWVFAGGLTNVSVQLTVTDTASGAVNTYRNPLGTPFAPLQDTSAFPCP